MASLETLRFFSRELQLRNSIKLTEENANGEVEPHALKDVRLVYRGCSPAFAQWLGQPSAAEVIGRLDQQLLAQDLANGLTADEQLLLRDCVPSVAMRPLNGNKCLLRLPLLDSEQQLQGVDLLVVEPQDIQSLLWQHFFACEEPEPDQELDQFSVLSDGEVLFSSYHSARRGSDQQLLRQVEQSLPESVSQWLEAGLPLQGDSRSGRLELSMLGRGRAQVCWSLVLWRGQPALAVNWKLQKPVAAKALSGFVEVPADDNYRDLVESSVNGVILLSAGVPVVANTSAALLLGFVDKKHLLEHQDFLSLLPQKLSSMLIESVFTPAAELKKHEGIWNTCSGGGAYLMSHVQQVQWEGLTCSYISLVDISHRHHAELSQLYNQQRFQDFAELAADFLWELDASLKFRFVSHRFEETLQISPKDVLGLSIQQFYERYFPPSDALQWRSYLQVLEERRPQPNFEYHWVRADGQERVIVHSCQPILDEKGRFEGYRGVGRDVTKDRALAAQVQFHATHDALTGLVNRREFERLLEEALEDAASSQQEHVLCYLDLDNFKVVNDTCGHLAGDELLRQLGDLFREQLRQSDVVARLGGDEFGIIFYSCSMQQALELADKIRQNVVDLEFLWEKKKFHVGASIGLSAVVAGSASANELMRAADTACYASKEGGRNRVTIAHEETSERDRGVNGVAQVEALLEEGGFQLWRQPILALNKAYKTGDYFEVLMRPVELDGSLVGAGSIMPTVERHGLCTRVDRAVFDKTLAWLVSARDQLDCLAMCNINISGQTLLDAELLQYIDREVKRSDIPPEKICFELTEAAVIANFSGARAAIAQLADTGCKLALDSFGSSASSFSFLRDLPIDFIKIDGSFVTRMLEDEICEEMVNSINRVSHVLNCATVAKSVENAQTLDALDILGVDFAQGFHVGRPEPIALPRQ